ncbi:MAG TPA: di-heme oxidoredictase family protein [Pirellulales bacterium]|nr:di-heme oxidoredictase family protein [Pirellulales bacterium]
MATFSKLNCVVAAIAMGVAGAVFAAPAEQGMPPTNTITPPATPANTSAAAAPDGKELFQREWIPNDPRSHGGDGLGPVFNDSSCVACHNQGGSGGGGTASKNVDIITAFVNPVVQQQQEQPAPAVQTLPGMILDVFVNSLSQTGESQPAGNNHAQPAASRDHQPANIQVSVVGDAQPAASNETQPATNNTPQAGPSQQTAAVSMPVPQTAAAATPVVQPKPEDQLAEINRQKQELAKIHPGFASARSVVLHRFSTDEKYESWRMQMSGLGQFNGAPNAPANSSEDADASAGQIQVTSDVEAEQKMQQLKTQAQLVQQQGLQGQMGDFSFVHSRRNPTALFGVGLIDQIPDQALIDQANKKFKGFPEIQGRVAKMKDGKLGRFGWKNQKASLYEFAMTACAVELGLDVPDHPQAGLPLNPNYKPNGHDLNQAECLALVDYLRNLPAPVQHKPGTPQEAEILSAGEKQFAAVGCANCHAQQLGNVTGIYSDLLLHDMGPELGDSGNYGVFVPDSPEEEQQADPIPSLQAGTLNGGPAHVLTKAEREKTFGALRQEWRTPPLWGVRDSGPYLHDGRAETLEQAVAFHGGEAANSAKQFFMLKPAERTQVVAFLKSLTAPEQTAAAE